MIYTGKMSLAYDYTPNADSIDFKVEDDFIRAPITPFVSPSGLFVCGVGEGMHCM